jgi:hypothetical protein
MSKSEMIAGSRGSFGSKFVYVGGGADATARERFMATGFGSRGGPNKVSNKLKRCPKSYLANSGSTLDYFMALALRSRGGPNKVSNKLRTRPSAYYQFN